MKQKYVFFFLLLVNATLFAQSYTPVDASSTIKFSIKNFGSAVFGTLKGLQGNINFNPKNLGSASINISVEAQSVNTNNGTRDNHLKKEDYFNVAVYPTINIASKKISYSNKDGQFSFEGYVTIKGVTKPISFPFAATFKDNDYLFIGQFQLNRRDFKVGGSSWVLADLVTINLSIIAKKN